MMDGPAGAAPKPIVEPVPAKPSEAAKADVVSESIKDAREFLDEAEKWRGKPDGVKLCNDFLQMAKRRVTDATRAMKP